MPRSRPPAAALAACLLLAGALSSPARGASLPMTFSGGSGAPLTITLPQAITYTITAAAPSGGALFDFKAVGNVIGGTVNVSGTLTYTINGGAPIAINNGSTNDSAGAIATNDLLLNRNPVPGGAALGDVLVLSPGSVTTAVNVAAAAPANGSYSAILVDQSGAQIAVGVPEPASASLLAAAALPLLTGRRRRTA